MGKQEPHNQDSAVFGRNLVRIMDKTKDERGNRTLVYQDIANRTGIAQSLIVRYGNGQYRISLENAKAIARAVGRTVDEMLDPDMEV